MTLINFDLRAVAATGRVPVDSRIRWQPVERRADGGVVILPEVHGVQLVAGVASADLDPGYYWFTESHQEGARAIRYVPAAGPVAYADLAAVDPATLAPTAQPEAAWLAMARATVTAGEVRGDELFLQRTDGTEDPAGNVRGPQGIQGVQGIQGIQGVAGIVTVNHGTNGATARPAVPVVYWVGTALPVNAIATDLWYEG